MINLILYLILFIEIVVLSRFDKNLFSNYFSPINILCYPLLIIVSIILIFSEILGFKPLNSNTLILFIIGIFIFWLGSFFWGKIIPRNKIEKLARFFSFSIEEKTKKNKNILLIISWLIILILIYSFLSTFIKYKSTNEIGTNEFIYEYAGSGIIGHIMGLTFPLLIILIGIAEKKDYVILLTILFFITLSVLYQVKSWLYLPIIGGILQRFFNNQKIKISFFKISQIIIVILLLFGLTYIFAMQDRKDATFHYKVYLLAKHFVGYLFAGVIGLGEHLNNNLPIGQNPKILIMPFLNIYHFITNSPIENVISSYHVFIDKNEIVDVNVKTFFGTIFTSGGFYIGIIYVFILSIIIYFLWILAILSKNFIIILLYTFNSSALAFGWFDLYYNLLPFIEISVYLIIIFFILKFKKMFYENNGIS